MEFAEQNNEALQAIRMGTLLNPECVCPMCGNPKEGHQERCLRCLVPGAVRTWTVIKTSGEMARDEDNEACM